MPDNIIALPHDVVEAFISYANARQIADTNFDPDILEQPLVLSAGRHRISLSNGYPGCSPFLQIVEHDNGHRVEVGAHYSTALIAGVMQRTEPYDVIHGDRGINLTYPLATAIAAYDLWTEHS